MIIRVICQDETYDMVKPFFLDTLISENKVKKFLRSEGWDRVGLASSWPVGKVYSEKPGLKIIVENNYLQAGTEPAFQITRLEHILLDKNFRYIRR